MNRLQEIETRLSAIKVELDKDDCNIEELTKETDALIEERKVELQKIEERKQTLDKLANKEIGQVIERKETKQMENTINKRSAFCKYLLNREMDETEKRALNLTTGGAVVPEVMAQDIISKIKSYAPVLNEITLLHVNGAVKYAVEGVTNGAIEHVENAQITPSEDTMVAVELNAKEITKLIQISASVQNMAIESFDAWLVETLAESIAIKIEQLIFANVLASIEPETTTSLTAQNVNDLFAALPSGYGRGSKLYMSRALLFSKFMPLRDNAKHEIVTREGENYFVNGVQVELTDSLGTKVVLGNMRKFVGNIAQEITIKTQEELRTNSYLFLGCAMYDGKVAIADAFVGLDITA